MTSSHSLAACHSTLPKEPRYCHPNLHGSLHSLSIREAGGAHNFSYVPGIEVNTLDGTLRLPQDRFNHLQQTLQLWSRHKSCTKLKLESLIGLLQHACRVIRPGRLFLRQLIYLLHSPHCPHYHICLNRQSWADTQWWRVFAYHWNSIALFPLPFKPGFEVTYDASGYWECGGQGPSHNLQGAGGYPTGLCSVG